MGAEEAVNRIVEAGAMPVTIGGDGSVTVPVTRAVAKRPEIWRRCTSTRTPMPMPTAQRKSTTRRPNSRTSPRRG